MANIAVTIVCDDAAEANRHALLFRELAQMQVWDYDIHLYPTGGISFDDARSTKCTVHIQLVEKNNGSSNPI